jgi:hypothetical protein
MRGLATALALVLFVPIASACSDDGTSPPTNKDGNSGKIDGGTADKGGGGGTLKVPVTVTMAAGLGGTAVSAQLCQNLAFGGGITWSLAPNSASPCLGGAAYFTFILNNSIYRVFAGKLLTSSGPGAAVKIVTTSEGSVTQNGGVDEVTNLPEKKDITIGTKDHPTITFTFSGNDVTVKKFQ